MSKEKELRILEEIQARMSQLEAADKALFQRKLDQVKQVEDQNTRLQKQEKILQQINIELDEISRESAVTAGITNDILTALTKGNLALKQQKSIANELNKISYQTLATRQGEMDINRKALENFNQKANVSKKILARRKLELQLQGNLTKEQQAELNNIKDLFIRLSRTQQVNEAILKTDRQIESSIGATASLLKGVDKSLQKAGLGSLGIADAFNQTKREAQQIAFETGKEPKGTKLLSMFSKNVFENFKDSLSTTKLLEAAVLAVGKAMMFIDKTSGSIAKNLGIANTEARELVSEFNELSMSTMDVFVNTKDLSEAFSKLTESLGVAKLASDAVLINFTKLVEQAGYSVEAATELTKLSAIQGTDSQGILENFLGQTEALNIQNGLQVSGKMLAESALKTSKATLLQLRGQGQSLAEAAFEAKKLGLELQQIEGVADSLLNIESSIAAEFEAEVMLGRQLNLERARYYALTNDIAGLANEMKKEAGSANEFAAMNRIEAEGLAKAFGMSREAMGEMLYEQEALSKLSGKANEDAQTRFNNLVREVGLEKAKKQLGNEQLANQMESANIQQRFQKALLKIQTLFLSLAEPLMPVVDAFVGILGFVGGIVAKLTPFLKILTGIYAVTKAFQLSILAINKGLAIGNALTKIRLFFTKDLLKFGKFIINYEGISNALSKSKNVEKVKEVALSKTGNVQAKAAILLNKIGLINGKQLAFWKGRETFLSNANNTNLKQRIFYEKASLANSIRKNIAEKIGLALGFEKAAIEKVGLTTLIQQNIQKALGITRDTTSLGLSVAKGASEKMTLKTLIAQGAAMLISIARNTINLGITIAKAAAEFAAATALTLGIGTGPLLAIAAAAAATVGGIVYAMTRGDDVLSNSTGGSGYGDRMLLGPEGAISLNNKDTVVAGTDLFKGDDVISAGEGQIQMGDAIDYNKLASAIGGAVNNKQVTLSYTDFAQKTRPVFG